MLIKGGNVLKDDFKFYNNEDIEISGEKIINISKDLSCDDVIDAKGCYVVPGLIDTHMHGAWGKSFIDFDNYDTDAAAVIARFEAKNGTTSLVPAISAAPFDKLLKVIGYMKERVGKDIENGSMIYGIHMEGPFFAEKYKGAHKPENIRYPDLSEVKEYLRNDNGIIKIMTLAPELPGAEKVIKYLYEHGVQVSAGHTDATYEDIKKSVNWGVTRGTHLFNAMSPLKHRAAGAVGGLLHENTVCEVICDFFHVNSEVIDLVYKIKGAEGIIMITDSEIGAGLPDGEYDVNGGKIYVKNAQARLYDGTIAGGSTCLITGVRNLVSLGIPLNEAVMTATKNPAISVGIYDKTGSISEGKTADLLVLDKDLELLHVILRGKLLF